MVCFVAQSCLTLCDPVDWHLCPWGFSRQEYWSGLPCPSPGNLLNPEIELRSPTLQVNSSPSEQPRKPENSYMKEKIYIFIQIGSAGWFYIVIIALKYFFEKFYIRITTLNINQLIKALRILHDCYQKWSPVACHSKANKVARLVEKGNLLYFVCWQMWGGGEGRHLSSSPSRSGSVSFPWGQFSEPWQLMILGYNLVIM